MEFWGSRPIKSKYTTFPVDFLGRMECWWYLVLAKTIVKLLKTILLMEYKALSRFLAND
jgi:hypothetical protein